MGVARRNSSINGTPWKKKKEHYLATQVCSFNYIHSPPTHTNPYNNEAWLVLSIENSPHPHVGESST
jgi:hypothetical protein